MKVALLLIIFSLALLVGCSEKRPNEAIVDDHAEAIRQFRTAQQLFKKSIATVRDEASYDKAAPALDQVVGDFRQVAVLMKELSPPAETSLANYRKLIMEGHHQSEPIGGDMMSMLTIESREKEISAWMEAFVAAGQEAGAEMKRLYGDVDYGRQAAPQVGPEHQAEQGAAGKPPGSLRASDDSP